MIDNVGPMEAANTDANIPRTSSFCPVAMSFRSCPFDRELAELNFPKGKSFSLNVREKERDREREEAARRYLERRINFNGELQVDVAASAACTLSITGIGLIPRVETNDIARFSPASITRSTLVRPWLPVTRCSQTRRSLFIRTSLINVRVIYLISARERYPEFKCKFELHPHHQSPLSARKTIPECSGSF